LLRRKGFDLKRNVKPGSKRSVWNKGQVIGQKLPLTVKQIRAIRIRLKSADQLRDLALFNLAIDGGLHACDILQLRVCDIAKGRRVLSRATIEHLDPLHPIQLDIGEETRDALATWIAHANLKSEHYLFRSRVSESPHIQSRQLGRLVSAWVESIGLDPSAYGTESLRRTKAVLMYQQTKDIFAVKEFLGHKKLDSTARFLGIES
jgi:integrase